MTKDAVFLIAIIVAFAVHGPGAAFAQRSYPMLMSISPAATTRGQSAEHVIESRYSMFGASAVLVSGAGITAEILTPMEKGADGKEPTLTQLRVRFHAAADALPGVRDVRVICDSGPSTVGQLVITDQPVVSETTGNDSREMAQPVSVPGTICGTIEKAEDVDYYRFSLPQSVSLTFHCLGMRLEDRIHDLQTHVDPILTLRNAATGATMASSDNSFAADPFFAQSLMAGDYLLEVRDVRYQGNKYWTYAIEVSDQPFVLQTFPPVVAAGQPSRLELVGENLANLMATEFSADPAVIPACTDTSTVNATLSVAGARLNPVTMSVTKVPVLVEGAGDNNSLASAAELKLPCVTAGRVETESDIDYYCFEAKKDDRISVETIARRNRSSLDSVLRILNDQGKPLTENDDFREWGRRNVQDSQIENWTVPADGRYFVEVRDAHLRGGPGYVYTLRVTKAVPTFDLIIDTDKTWLTPGTSAPIFVRVNRRNGFVGEVQLSIDGLPAGVSSASGRIAGEKSLDGCIVLTAAPECGPVAANVQIQGTAVVPGESGETTVTVTAQPMQETYMPGGGRSHFPVEMHTVAVGHPSDLREVRITPEDITLKPGESGKIDVELVRSEGFDKNVTLDVLFQHLSSVFANTLPPGVTIDAKASQTLLTGKNTKGSIVLTAAKDARPADRQQCCVMANVSINFVMKATYSSRPLFVTVKAP